MVEYRIGGIDVNRRKFSGCASSAVHHKFLVVAEDGVASIYVGQNEELSVVKRFKLTETACKGGGSIYLDDEERLVLDDFSGYCGTIPSHAAQRFAELLIPELAKKKIRPRGISVNTEKLMVNEYWMKEAAP